MVVTALAKNELRLYVFLFCCIAVPLDSLCVVLCYAIAVVIAQAKVKLCLC